MASLEGDCPPLKKLRTRENEVIPELHSLKKLLSDQQATIDSFFKQLDSQEFFDFAEKLWTKSESGGIIFFCGIGKSGIAAEAISTLVTSFGIRSLSLSPQNALHGDIGIVTGSDAVVFISKSGNSQELLDLLPFVKKKEAETFALTCNLHGHLAQRCSHHMFLPLAKELCPFNMSPSSSTSIQVIFGHTLAIYLAAHKKKTSLEEYGNNHPSGTIGKRLSLQVTDIMRNFEDTPICKSENSLLEALMAANSKKAGGCFLIDENKKLVGVITDGDFRRFMSTNGNFHMKLSEVANKNPLCVTEGTRAYDALLLMQEKKITMLPIVDENKILKGFTHLHSLLECGLGQCCQLLVNIKRLVDCSIFVN